MSSQSSSKLDAPSAAVVRLAPQATHSACAARSWYWPRGHALQAALATPGAKVPAGQLSHAVAVAWLPPGEKEPLPHAVHELESRT